SHRASMFGIEYVHVGREKKEMIAEKWLHQLNLDWNQCGYIGDDINDKEMMKRVGISGAPANAVSSIKAYASFVLQQNGGFGCVREFISYLPGLKDQL
ncbi:MAG: HAD hydrolase family protein, partial [Salibacteraceae bacterium]|nr:HAD hydrolase family protein [Salibacteraceae bacterium]